MQPPSSDPSLREQARRRRAQQVQRRRLVLSICVLGLIVLVVGLVVGLSGGPEGADTASSTTAESTATPLVAATYNAELTGAESVPSVTTKATGSLTLTYDPDTAALTFVLDINGLTNPSLAAIYEGVEGARGIAVATLFAGPPIEGLFAGVLAEGSIDETQLTGGLTGKTVADLVTLIESGNAYVSVGNTSHPVDAIRGQID